MPRKRNSLKHDIFIAVTKNVTNNTSRTSYKRSATCFANWAKENNIKNTKAILFIFLTLFFILIVTY